MKKVKIERRGRVCKSPGCHNTLSIYNHSPFCHIHQSKLMAQEKMKILEA
ncbi:MAG: hypothetical protein WC732_03200 [Candidatus Omnitrophota bacterium]